MRDAQMLTVYSCCFRRGNTSEDLLRDAQMFAYMLSQKWAMAGSCNESLLILYARYDGIVGFVVIILLIIMEICKSPTLRLKVLYKQITYIKMEM